MKKNKLFTFLIQKALLDEERPNVFFDEGSFIIDPNITKKRFMVILNLFKRDGIFPTKDVVRAVDICVFVCKDVANPADNAYELFKKVYKKFTGNMDYDTLQAKEGLLELCKVYYLNQKGNENFFVNFEKKVLTSAKDCDDALGRMYSYIRMLKTSFEKYTMNKTWMRLRDKLLDWGR